MSGALRELFAKFDVDTSAASTKLQGLNGAVNNIKASFGTLAASFVGAFSVHAFAGFIEDQIRIGSVLNDTAEKLGVSTTELQKFQFAAGLSGVSAEGAANSLRFLNKNLGEAIGGATEQSQTFAALGIDLAGVKSGSKTATDLLPQLADKFAAAGSDAERTALSMKLFGKSGAEMLPLLRQGGAELAKLGQEFEALGGGLDEDFIKTADKAGDEIDKLKFAFGGLKARIAADVLPGLTKVVQSMQKGIVWFRGMAKETNIVKEGLAILGVTAGLAGAKAAIGWAKFFGVFPKGNVGIVKTLASLGSFGLIIGAVAGLALVFEDLWVGINGGESVIKDWLVSANGVENTETLFAQLRATADQIWQSFQGMRPAIGSVLSALASIAVSPEFIASIEFIVRMLGSMVALLVGAARAAGNIVTGDFKGAGKAVDQAGDSVFGKNGFFGEKAFEKPVANVRPVNEAFVGPSYLDPSSKDFQGGAVEVKQTNTVNVTVQAGKDAQATGKAVGEAVRGVYESDKASAAAALKRGT